MRRVWLSASWPSQNRRHRAKAEELASEQAALRRVATLVAKGVPEGKVFAAVAKEVGSLADADAAQIFRYEPDGSVVRLAAWGSGTKDLKIGARYPAGAHNVAAMVLHWAGVLASTTPAEDRHSPHLSPGHLIPGRWSVTRSSWTAACGAS